jgi:hypothetical protein
MVSARQSARPGVHFLFEALDPKTVMAQLQKAGI